MVDTNAALGTRGYWRAGWRVAGIRSIAPVAVIVRRFVAALACPAGAAR